MAIFNIREALSESISQVIDLVNANLSYYKIVAYEKLILIMAKLISKTILVLTLFMVLFFASLGLATFLGEIFRHTFIGYLIVATTYLLLGLLVYRNRIKWIINPLISDLSLMFEPINQHEIPEEDEV